MNNDWPALQETRSRPVIVHPGPVSWEDLLRYIDPSPDAETEHFIAAIYADRRERDCFKLKE